MATAERLHHPASKFCFTRIIGHRDPTETGKWLEPGARITEMGPFPFFSSSTFARAYIRLGLFPTFPKWDHVI
jgi:hypothetical protein